MCVIKEKKGKLKGWWVWCSIVYVLLFLDWDYF